MMCVEISLRVSLVRVDTAHQLGQEESPVLFNPALLPKPISHRKGFVNRATSDYILSGDIFYRTRNP